ncbi:MAG: hypothetical protein AAF074_07965 [Pseudomonadota bacterium]
MPDSNTVLAAIVAGCVGVLVGAAGNVDDRKRERAMEARLSTIEADLAAATSGMDEIDSNLGAVREAMPQLAAVREAVLAMNSAMPALAEAVDASDASMRSELAALRQSSEAAMAAIDERLAALDTRIAEMPVELAALQPGEDTAALAAPEAPSAADLAAARAEALAAEIGADGLALAFGESGMAGDARVFLSRMDGVNAVLHVAGGGGDFAVGPDAGAAALANGCEIALAGTAARTAFLAVACPEGAATVAETAPPPAPEPLTLAALEGADAMRAAAGEAGLDLGVGETGTVGEASVFFSRMQGEDAVIFVRGQGQVALGPNAGSAVVGGCRLSLVGVSDGRAFLRPDC